MATSNSPEHAGVNSNRSVASSARTTPNSKNSAEDLVASRDLLAEGLFGLLKPCIIELDARVKATKKSQIHLRKTIDDLAEDLRNISDSLRTPVDFDAHAKKLQNCKRRIIVINNILAAAQDRLTRLHKNVLKETAKKRALLDPVTKTPTTPGETIPSAASASKNQQPSGNVSTYQASTKPATESSDQSDTTTDPALTDAQNT